MEERQTGDADRLSGWLDRLEIRETLAEYFRALTRGDAARAKAAFHADAHEDHGPLAGRAHDLIDEIVANSGETYERTVRHVLDVAIEFDGDKALSEAGWINILRTRDDDMFYAGRYVDRWERRGGPWKIAARVALVDWWRFEPRSERPFYEGAEAILKFSGRGLDDPELRAALGAS